MEAGDGGSELGVGARHLATVTRGAHRPREGLERGERIGHARRRAELLHAERGRLLLVELGEVGEAGIAQSARANLTTGIAHASR